MTNKTHDVRPNVNTPARRRFAHYSRKAILHADSASVVGAVWLHYFIPVEQQRRSELVECTLPFYQRMQATSGADVRDSRVVVHTKRRYIARHNINVNAPGRFYYENLRLQFCTGGGERHERGGGGECFRFNMR